MESLYVRFCVGDAHDHTNQNEWRRCGTRMGLLAARVALALVLVGTGCLFSQDNSNASATGSVTGDKGAQIAAIHRLQAAFHRATTVHDPVNGDSTDVINERIQAMLSLWTDNGWMFFSVGSARDGYYIGNGDPTNPSTCPAPSDNFANRGTLCTFFKYVAAPFQPGNEFVSLAPSYKTEIHVYGAYATLYFECHLFNVAMDPATGKPLWAAAGHLAVDGAATKVGNRWLFSHANVSVAGVPVP